MFTFRRLTLLFFILLLCLNFWNIFLGKSATGLIHTHASLLYSMIFVLYFGISFTMAFLPCSNFHHQVICHGDTDEKIISITFDDGPDFIKTPEILNILKKHNIPATFFCIGKNVADHVQIVKLIDDGGHLLGNHSFSHSKWFSFFPARKMRSEMKETDRLISQITGKSPLFYRPPFGVVNPMVSNSLKMTHWKAICWNIRSMDTVSSDHRNIMNRILHRLEPGSIILLHDFTPFVEKNLDELLVRIKEAGYQVVPLDKLLNIPAYA